MTTIANSTFRVGPPQADGRCYITETHLLSDGRGVRFEYLADPTQVDPAAVMSARAERVASEIAANELAVNKAAEGSVPLTKFQFRQRFTYAERLAIDAFNASFETNAALTDAQKAGIRTALNDLDASGAVYLDLPVTQAGVQLYETLGLITPGRAAEILNG